jgi:hypothetical protein
MASLGMADNIRGEAWRSEGADDPPSELDKVSEQSFLISSVFSHADDSPLNFERLIGRQKQALLGVPSASAVVLLAKPAPVKHSRAETGVVILSVSPERRTKADPGAVRIPGALWWLLGLGATLTTAALGGWWYGQHPRAGGKAEHLYPLSDS